MTALVRKMKKLGLLKLEMIGGGAIMAAAVLGLPIGILVTDASLLANPYLLGVVLVAMLLFGLVGYFRCIRPYLLYQKYPEVQAETDGEFLYIHAKKEAKIPLSEITEADVQVNLPYLLQKEFLYDLVIHLLSERYGDVILELPGHGTYKMRFVAEAEETADQLIRFLDKAMNQETTV